MMSVQIPLESGSSIDRTLEDVLVSQQSHCQGWKYPVVDDLAAKRDCKEVPRELTVDIDGIFKLERIVCQVHDTHAVDARYIRSFVVVDVNVPHGSTPIGRERLLELLTESIGLVYPLHAPDLQHVANEPRLELQPHDAGSS